MTRLLAHSRMYLSALLVASLVALPSAFGGDRSKDRRAERLAKRDSSKTQKAAQAATLADRGSTLGRLPNRRAEISRPSHFGVRDLAIISVARAKSSLQANEPPYDGFVRVRVKNTGTLRYQSGRSYTVYARKLEPDGGGWRELGQGSILYRLDPGDEISVLVMRPREDRHKDVSESIYDYRAVLSPGDANASNNEMIVD